MRGLLYKNEQGRFQIEDSSYYFTCGDAIQIFYDDKWLSGAVEFDEDYYFTDSKISVRLEPGMLVRVEEE